MKKYYRYARWITGVFTCLLFLSVNAVQAQGMLTYGSITSANVSAEAPIAIYLFNGAAGDLASVRVFSLVPDAQPTVSLFTATQQQLATNSGNPFSPGLAELSLALPETGVYTLFVSSAAGTPGEFVVRLDGSAPPPPQALDAAVPTGAALSDVTPAVYSVAASPAAPVTVTVSTATPGFAFAAALRNPDGATVSVSNGSDTTPILATLPPGTGTYTLEVRPAIPGTTGEVALSVGAVTTAPPSDTAIPAPEVTEEVGASATVCTATAISGVNVRSGPSTDYVILQALPAGTSAEVVGLGAGWYVISLPGTPQGWVFGDLVTLSGPCDALAAIPIPPLPLQPTATYTATPTPTVMTGDVTPTATLSGDQPTPTYTPTTSGDQPTATYTPTTSGDQPTATYTPTTSTEQIAPQDSGSNGPLVIQLDSTESVLDFVSYPNGDTEDRVPYRVDGMNNNVAFSGGRAQLTITASCFGENTDQIQFFAGGQTYSCGQTVVDREVTADSDTGSVVVTAIGGEGTYVQWVLTGTATRLN